MSIKENALLVAITTSKPTMTKTDRKATADAEIANNAMGAGKYVKDLYPKHLVAPIVETEARARQWLYSQTLMWARGVYLLPAAKFMDFAERMGKFEIEFDQQVTAFLNNYANALSTAQLQQGDLFDPSVYPDTSELRAQFSFKVKYMPIADHNDFRVSMQEDDLEHLRKQVADDTRQQVEATMKESVERLRGAVAAIAARLTETRTNKKGEDAAPIFRDSLIENLDECVETLRGFDFLLPEGAKPLLDAANAQLNVNPDMLRASPDIRKQTAINATALLSAIDELMI